MLLRLVGMCEVMIGVVFMLDAGGVLVTCILVPGARWFGLLTSMGLRDEVCFVL